MNSFKYILITLITLLMGCGEDARDLTEEGSKAYSDKNYVEAEKFFREAAEQGDITAQTMLGTMYLFGQGVQQDRQIAEKWLLKAAEANNTDAQSIIGMMYYNGMGVPRDLTKAVKWLTLAIENGDEEAKDMLKLVQRQQMQGGKRIAL